MKPTPATGSTSTIRGPSEAEPQTIRSLIEALTQMAKAHNRNEEYRDKMGDGFNQPVLIDRWRGRGYDGLTDKFEVQLASGGVILTPRE